MMATENKVSHQTQRDVERLRFDARMAYLDGRTKRAKYLNRAADKLSRKLASETSGP